MVDLHDDDETVSGGVTENISERWNLAEEAFYLHCMTHRKDREWERQVIF